MQDQFGYGNEKREEAADYTKEDVRNIVDMTKVMIAQGKPLPDKLRQAVYNIPDKSKEIYGGFFNVDEDFAEEVDTIKSYVAGDFKQRKDGRYVWDSLVLGEGETPEDFILNAYPPGDSGPSFGYGPQQGQHGVEQTGSDSLGRDIGRIALERADAR